MRNSSGAANVRVGANNYCLPERLAGKLGRLFAGGDVLDVGCGVGAYGKYFRSHAPSVRWIGVDGSENIEEATDGHVHFVDLASGLPYAYQRVFDWKMSIEVAEHLPRVMEPMFMHSVAANVRSGVVISWAVPGQVGGHHVNLRTTNYKICVFKQLGFDFDSNMTRELRGSIVPYRRDDELHGCSWLVKTLLTFRRTANGLPTLHLPRYLTAEFIAAYQNVTRTHCLHQ